VFERIISALSSFSSSGVRVLTVARVPTGINIGVLILPCGVVKTPVLAWEFFSSFFTLKLNIAKKILTGFEWVWKVFQLYAACSVIPRVF